MSGSAGGQVPPHQPVLYQEIIHALLPRRGGRYLDATTGAGGHAASLLEASQPDGRLLGLEVDPQALQLAQARLKEYGDRAILSPTSYVHLHQALAAVGWESVDGVLFDLGVSSMQLDTAGRGFSFQQDGPLDMRFSPGTPRKASDLVNDLPERELADLIYRYGEERRSRAIARAIVAARPLATTRQLAEVVARAVGGRRGARLHPATRTFQALRIAVNEELQALEAALPQAVAVLAPGGRLAVIAYQSLEDRVVKRFFQRESKDCICPPGQPTCTCDHRASVRLVARKPLRPSPQEIHANPRARSARLRVAEKLGPQGGRTGPQVGPSPLGMPDEAVR